MSGAYHRPEGPVQILHRDASLLVVVKPAGLLSVPGKAEGAEDCLIARLGRMDRETRLVHRLDRDTSGVMVFARSKQAQRHLGRQFERRYVSKAYEAVVAGHLDGAGEVDLPLVADWPNRPRQMVCHARGRPARTRWRALSHDDGATRVALAPETGRSHQLRVHMAALGHPILGDPLYGLAEGADAPRLMLHASRLAFRHPEGGTPVAFESRPPF
ncbi:RluA family pseudouridine synthase [Rhodovulum sp. 12E13]|uniref:RluA family pseudouridine synthase n=1 Tax=Rhodovulum sp. 12E13 TaxID=2203891 RepID=UPI000E1AFB36|nr:RluA family pseudouridine synthase [Rhodovulum sp. 12E13]RDC71564.1 RluA family pseudouridine synthase [Rhodovulum sp. 12E13]